MEPESKPVPKHPRRLRTPEEKLALLQEWRRDLERGLANRGELVPKGQVLILQKRVDELEKALGRSSLENQILKKFFEIKGLKLPEGM